jgi:hypothetical protein
MGISMNRTTKNITAIGVTGLWVNASEFFRNEVLLKSYWVDHYRTLGLEFPSAPVNGMMWMVWGFLFAAVIRMLSEKYHLVRATLLSWTVGFVLMWIVIWNLLVLPLPLLLFAVPLSLLEAFIGTLLCQRLAPKA